jgi:hypothetical protein
MLRTDYKSEGGTPRDLHPSLPRFLPGRLSVENEANGDSKRTNKGTLSCLVRWSFHAGTRDFCPAWAAL